MLGADCDEDDREFRQQIECYAFAEPLNFTQTQTDEAVEYSKQTVTLHKVVNGNARSMNVDRRALRFDRLTRVQ